MNVRNSLLQAFAASGSNYISGAALAEQLGVSRNAVWKAVKALESEGYIIESVTAKGYRLSKDSNHLSEQLIASRLGSSGLGGNIIVLDETDSTNNYAKELASKNAPHGTVVVADRQTAGKGRLGRTFVSHKGKGLYMSVILRPDFDISAAPLITSAAAVAAAEAVEQLCGSDVRIKWVNDLYMNGRKICGILTEASMDMEMRSLESAVIGIGINVRKTGDSFDEELSRRATSIEDETGASVDRNELCAAIVSCLDKRLGTIEDRSYLGEYRRRELLTGNIITANIGNETFTGKAVGIDDNANLVVETENGAVRALSSGEANLCRIYRGKPF